MFNIYNTFYIKALDDYLNNTNAFFERRIRRWYSTTFHTPLRDVYDLDWQFVMMNYFESMLDKKSKNEVIDMVIGAIPELSQDEERENQEYADSLVAEQEQQMRNKEEREEKNRFKKDPNYVGNCSDIDYMKKAQGKQIVTNKSKEKDKQQQSLEYDNKGVEIPNVNLVFDDEEY